MKRLFVFGLVLILLFTSFSPVLAGNGNGGGGGNGGGNGGGHQNENGDDNGHNGLGGGGQDNYAMVGIVTDINGSAGAANITIAVYGGQDKTLVGTTVTVPTNSDTKFVLQDSGIIPFEDLQPGDIVSVAMGADGNAERVTVVVDCPCLMY